MNTPSNTARSFSTTLPGAILSLGTVSGSTQVAVDAITKCINAIKPQIPMMDLAVVGLDRAQTQLYFSSVAIVDKISRAAVVILLAASNNPLPWVNETVPNGVISVPVTPADSIDSQFSITVSQTLGNMFGKGEALTLNYLVAPRVLQITEETMAAYVVQAATIIYRCANQVEDLDLSRYGAASFLAVNASTAVREEIGLDGLPRFFTHTITVSGGQQAAGGKNRINDTAQRTIVEVNAFVDAAWAPGPRGGVQGAPIAHYIPRAILRQGRNNAGNSIESHLLGLAAATCLGNQQAWAAQYLGRHPLLNVGALLSDPSIAGKTLDTTAADVTIEDMYKLIGELFQPTMVYSMAIPRYSITAIGQEVFVAASRGNADANAEIIASANRLTGGHFGTFFRGTRTVVVNGSPDNGNDDVMAVGTWLDNEQRLNSTGKIDNVVGFMCRAGDQGAGALSAYTETKMTSSGPARVRLAKTQALLHQLTGGYPIEIHDVERLVTFTREFIDALSQAVQACTIKLNVNITNPMTNVQMRPSFTQAFDLSVVGVSGGMQQRAASYQGGVSW